MTAFTAPYVNSHPGIYHRERHFLHHITNHISLMVTDGRLSSVFVSHFLLDLQECHQRMVIGLETGDLPHSSQSFDVSDGSVHFAPALGSLGAILGTLDDNDLEPGDEMGVEDWSRASKDSPPYGRGVIRDSRIEDELDVTEVPCGDGGAVRV